MGRPKPLKRLLEKARDSRARHRERHRPSGFGFLVADSIKVIHHDEPPVCEPFK